MFQYKHILITGASSGLGRALAIEYAQNGLTLTLWARDGHRLEKTAAECRAKGASVSVISQDVRDRDVTTRLMKEMDEKLPIDAAFLAAGVITGTTRDGRIEPPEDASRTLAVNLTAATGMGYYLFERMRSRSAGHIVFISSIAGMYPLPNSPAYSASKIGVSSYARALAGLQNKVRVSCVYPGYLDTPMGRRLQAVKPMTATAKDMASVVRRKLEAGSDKIIHPWPVYFAVRFLSLLPKKAADYLACQFGYTVVPDAESPLA